jgi:hypothetical protein
MRSSLAVASPPLHTALFPQLPGVYRATPTSILTKNIADSEVKVLMSRWGVPSYPDQRVWAQGAVTMAYRVTPHPYSYPVTDADSCRCQLCFGPPFRWRV